MDKMIVVLSAKSFGKKRQEVASLAEASSAWDSFRDENNFGASALLADSGKVFNGKQLVATISYNGRIWPV